MEAVGTERISRIVGYVIDKGDFSTVTPNLPQRVALLGEASTAQNSRGLDLTPTQITSAQQAGSLYGYGSPIHIMARILFPQSGGGIGGVPVVVYPQAQAVGATSKKITITPSGVATGNGTHTVKIGGRAGLDGVFYDIAINTGDTTADITAKISDVVNTVLGAPVIGTYTDYTADLESKWKGLTADGLSVTIDVNGNNLGIAYYIASTQSGSGTPSIASALTSFGNEWYTLVINSYGTVSSVVSALESFNGVPSTTAPTGRYTGIIMKPFVALTGSVADDDTTFTDAHLNDVTIAICPAPLSAGLAMEAAANVCGMEARCAQDTPHLDIEGWNYPDMPTPTVIGSMADYNNRDLFVKKGCSTVDLVAGQYVVQDFVTTYHPEGENPPQFRYVRNLMLDFNVRFGYYLLEQINVVNHTICADSDTVSVGNVIKPKTWKALLFGYADDLAKRALVVDGGFMKNSIDVRLSTSNPDRLQTNFSYKRSGVVRIASTVAKAGFNFGTLN